MPATCIIGDIHGRADHLLELVREVRKRFGSEVRFVGVGDYIDRGPDSKQVVEIMVKLGATGLLGNHEVWMVEYLLTGDIPTRLPSDPMMGAMPTILSYMGDYPKQTGLDMHNTWLIARELRQFIPESHQEFFKTLACSLRLDIAGVTYWVTHGGLKYSTVERIRASVPDRTIPEELLVGVAERVELDSMIWLHHDTVPLYHFTDGSVQVFGHCPNEQVVSTPNYIALDTGSGRKRRQPNVLSAVVLPDSGGRHIITGGRWVS